MCFCRAALKSGRTCDQDDDVSETVAHFSEESWTGAITGAGLAANPGARFALDSPIGIATKQIDEMKA